MKKTRFFLCLLAACSLMAYGQDGRVCVDDVLYTEASADEATVFGLCDGQQYGDTLVVHDAVTINGAVHRVTELGEEAFPNLGRLKVLKLPASLEMVGSNAVYSCSKLECIYSYATNPPAASDESSFSNLPKNTILYVPSSAVDMYSRAKSWKSFGQNILPIPTKAKPGDTLIARSDPSGLQTRLYYQVLDTARSRRKVRLIAPEGGYNVNNMTGRLILPDSVQDGVGTRFAVAEAQPYVLRGCTLLTQPVFLSDTVLVYSGLGRVTDTVPTQVTSIAVGAYIDGRQTASLECLQQYPPRCETGSLDGLDMKIPIFVSKSALKDYQNADEWRKRKLTPHLSVGDTIVVDYPDPDFELIYEIVNNNAGHHEVCLIGGTKVKGDVQIPDSVAAPGGANYAVVALADSVLMNQSGIGSLTIGWCVRQIGHHAFAHADMLRKITVDRYNPVFHSVVNSNAVIETQTGRLVLGCQSSLVADGVTAIGVGAFCGQILLREINLPSSIRTIESRAYDGCSGVQSIHLLGDVPTLEDDSSFMALCKRLGVYVLPEYVPNYEAAWPDVQIRSFVVPAALGDTVTCDLPGQDAKLWLRVTDNALFHSEVMLVRTPSTEALPIDTVILPDTICDAAGARYFLTEISDSVWAGASELKRVVVSSTVERIASKAFNGLALTSMDVAVRNPYYNSLRGCNAIVETETYRLVAGCCNTKIDNSVRVIGAYALAGVGLTDVILPYGLRSIEEYGLAGNNLSRISCRGFEPCAMAAGSLDGVNRGIAVHIPIGTEDAYAAAPVWNEFEVFLSYVPELEVGDVFEYVTPEGRLLYCQVLDTVATRRTVAVVRPDEVPYMVRGTMVVPDTVFDPTGRAYETHTLGVGVFAQCRIDSLVLPATLMIMESGALQDCGMINAIRCEALVPPTVTTRTVFDGVSKEAYIYVHRECLNQYAIVAGWQRFFNILPIEDEPEGVDLLESPLKGETVKCIVNGQMVIVRGEQKYDVVGRRIQ